MFYTKNWIHNDFIPFGSMYVHNSLSSIKFRKAYSRFRSSLCLFYKTFRFLQWHSNCQFLLMCLFNPKSVLVLYIYYKVCSTPSIKSLPLATLVLTSLPFLIPCQYPFLNLYKPITFWGHGCVNFVFSGLRITPVLSLLFL